MSSPPTNSRRSWRGRKTDAVYDVITKPLTKGPVPPPRGKRGQIPVKGDGGCGAFSRSGEIRPHPFRPFSLPSWPLSFSLPRLWAGPPVSQVKTSRYRLRLHRRRSQPYPKPADRKETPARTDAVKPAAGQTAAPAESTPDPGFRRRAPKTPPGSVTAPAVQSTPASPHKAAASSPSSSKSAASEQGGPLCDDRLRQRRYSGLHQVRQ